MKRGCPTHPKTAALADILGVELFAAVGLLEMLWHFTATYAPRGDVGQFTDLALARHLGWRSSPGGRRHPGRLVSAMVQSGWLDPDPTFRLLVHGWAEHADQGVVRKLSKSGQSFATATTSSQLVPISCELDETSLARAQAVAVAVPLPCLAVAMPSRSEPTEPTNGAGNPRPVVGVPEDQRSEYADAVWSAFIGRTKEPTRLMSRTEFEAVKDWMDEGVPLRVVLQAIDETKNTGRTLSYFAASVSVEYERWRLALSGTR